MSLVSSIPESVSVAILTQWSGVEEIVQVDTAFCNKKNKEKLLNMFSLSGFVLRNAVTHYGFIGMALRRQFKLSSIKLHDLYTLTCIYGPTSQRDLHQIFNVSSPIIDINSVSLIPKLTGITLTDFVYMASFVHLLAACKLPLLKKIRIQCRCRDEYALWSDVHSLLSNSPHLTEFHLINTGQWHLQLHCRKKSKTMSLFGIPMHFQWDLTELFTLVTGCTQIHISYVEYDINEVILCHIINNNPTTIQKVTLTSLPSVTTCSLQKMMASLCYNLDHFPAVLVNNCDKVYWK